MDSEGSLPWRSEGLSVSERKQLLIRAIEERILEISKIDMEETETPSAPYLFICGFFNLI